MFVESKQSRSVKDMFFLNAKVQPGLLDIQRHQVENFGTENTFEQVCEMSGAHGRRIHGTLISVQLGPVNFKVDNGSYF
jgi:hypothetical protein